MLNMESSYKDKVHTFLKVLAWNYNFCFRYKTHSQIQCVYITLSWRMLSGMMYVYSRSSWHQLNKNNVFKSPTQQVQSCARAHARTHTQFFNEKGLSQEHGTKVAAGIYHKHLHNQFTFLIIPPQFSHFQPRHKQVSQRKQHRAHDNTCSRILSKGACLLVLNLCTRE